MGFVAPRAASPTLFARSLQDINENKRYRSKKELEGRYSKIENIGEVITVYSPPSKMEKEEGQHGHFSVGQKNLLKNEFSLNKFLDKFIHLVNLKS